MLKKGLIGAIIVFSIVTGSLRARDTDKLFEAFQNPPSNYRPLARWWWSGGYVTENEILRELDVMKAGGIGGVEINTIGMLEAVPLESLARFNALAWLSPEWNQMVRIAAYGARERGMTADLIVGSGWPFGGRFLQPEEQTKRITLVKKDLKGPQQFQSEIKALFEGRRRSSDEIATEPRLAFLRLVPSGKSGFISGDERKNSASSDGRISLTIPEGEFTLYCGLLEEGFTFVKLGAPGADGPVVDHFNAAAVGKYLDNMAGKLAPALEGQLGKALRAMFVDSLELDHANWTGDLPAEFRRRRGYELEPYLPFVLDWQGVTDETPGSDLIFRARYDFCKTQIELFHERFLRTYIDWCHRNGVQGRIQAYGRETHPLEGSLLVDLPEGESWLWSDRDKVVPMPTVANKYVSSAAHLAGKSWISFEAMTNAVPVFRETLEDIKLCFDMSLATGVIHPVLHGFNYTPPEAGFPGWVRFGSYFNEKNPWWPHFRRWSDYASRLTAVLEQTKPGPASVAVLGPRADEWVRYGLLYQPFPETALPWYHYHLWQALQQNGVASDFVSENVLQQASLSGRKFSWGAREYEALVILEMDSMEPATARAIEKFAGEGVKVIFTGRVPRRSPGLQNADGNDREVRGAISSALKADPGRVGVFPSPQPATTEDERKAFARMGWPDAERRNLLEYAGSMIRKFKLSRFLQIGNPSIHVAPVEHLEEGRQIYFLANISRAEAVDIEVDLTDSVKSPWRWDPLSGARMPLSPIKPNRIPIHMEPAESFLLVLESSSPVASTPAAPFRADLVGEDPVPAVGKWQVEFRHVDPARSFNRKMETLMDLSKAADDPAMRTFAGTAVYRLVFQAKPDSRTLLDLGQVFGVSEVMLNGRPLGVRWYGRHVYDAGRALKPGTNRLEVRVTTMLGNYCKYLSGSNPVAKRWASWFPPIASGMVGPVRLLRPK